MNTLFYSRSGLEYHTEFIVYSISKFDCQTSFIQANVSCYMCIWINLY